MIFKFTPEQTNVSVPYELQLKDGNIVSDSQEFNILYDGNIIGNISFNLSNISFLFHAYLLNNSNLKKFVKCSNEKIIHHLDSSYNYANLYSMSKDTGYCGFTYFDKEDQEIHDILKSYLFLIKRLYEDLSGQMTVIDNACEKLYKCVSVTISIFDKSYYDALIYCDSLEEFATKYDDAASSRPDSHTTLGIRRILSLIDAYGIIKHSYIHLNRLDNILKYRHILPMLNTLLIDVFGKHGITNTQEKTKEYQYFIYSST